VGTDRTGDFSLDKAIEKTILRVLGSSEFSHSLGQKSGSVGAFWVESALQCRLSGFAG
jgi:hypothetical protein